MIWRVFAARGMGYFAGRRGLQRYHAGGGLQRPPDPSAPKGSIAGTVTSSDTGLALPGVTVGFGGLTTNTTPPFPDFLAPATSGANGAYSLQAPAGTYGDLVYDRPGWDRVVVSPVEVPAGGTRALSFALRRDWAAARGGADIDTSDNSGAPFGCGAAQLIDQSLGTGWSALNPGNPARCPDGGHRTACDDRHHGVRDGSRQHVRRRRDGDDQGLPVETSADGVNFRLAKAGAFTLADARAAEHGRADGERHRRAVHPADAALAAGR